MYCSIAYDLDSRNFAISWLCRKLYNDSDLNIANAFERRSNESIASLLKYDLDSRHFIYTITLL